MAEFTDAGRKAFQDKIDADLSKAEQTKKQFHYRDVSSEIKVCLTCDHCECEYIEDGYHCKLLSAENYFFDDVDELCVCDRWERRG